MVEKVFGQPLKVKFSQFLQSGCVAKGRRRLPGTSICELDRTVQHLGHNSWISATKYGYPDPMLNIVAISNI